MDVKTIGKDDITEEIAAEMMGMQQVYGDNMPDMRNLKESDKMYLSHCVTGDLEKMEEFLASPDWCVVPEGLKRLGVLSVMMGSHEEMMEMVLEKVDMPPLFTDSMLQQIDFQCAILKSMYCLQELAAWQKMKISVEKKLPKDYERTKENLISSDSPLLGEIIKYLTF